MNTQTNLDLPSGCAVTGTVRPGFESILTREALEFVVELKRKFGPRVEELLARREARQKEIDAGKLPDFLHETRAIREREWHVTSIPADLQDRRVEITGPTDRKMIINALNSGAKVFIAQEQRVIRLLATLEHRGYIEQNKETENYRLGPRTLQIGSIFIEQRECRRQARPLLEGLAAETGETSVIAVLRATKVVVMDGVQTSRTVRAISRIGAMLQAHSTAVGKVQLAHLSPAEIERLYPAAALPAVTPRTLQTRETLLNELEAVRERGFAFEDEECDLDVSALAAPVRDFSGTVIAAIGVVAPATRLSVGRNAQEGIASRVLDAARVLSSRLGYRPDAQRR